MFDVGFSEIVLLAIVALVVLGPEKLPHAARVAGAWVGRIRRTISTVQEEIEREVSAQELKARMEKELGPGGLANFTGSFVSQVKQETDAIGAELKATENVIAPAITAAGMSVAMASDTAQAASNSEQSQENSAILLDVPTETAAAANTVSPHSPSAVDAPPPLVLPDIAKPLDSITMDGEAAYRQWLDSQKRNAAAGMPSQGQDPAS